VPARLLMMGIGTRRLQPQPDGHPGSRGRAPGLVMARLSSHRGMEPGLGQVSCAGVDQFVPWGRAERAGPGRVERPGGKTASPGPAPGGSGSALTAGATSGRADAIRGEPRSSPASALPGITRLRSGHAAALVELSPVAVPDSGFGAGDISNAGSKVLAVSIASAAGTGYPSPAIYLDRSLTNLGGL
jgi:hypothetical protein